MPFLLVIPVAIIFYLIGRWLTESVKRDEEKEKIKALTTPVQKNKSPDKSLAFEIFNIVITVLAVIAGVYFVIAAITGI
jgi:uncharacterized protein (UPF0333 family)